MFPATVIDIGTRRLVGYSMAEHMRADLVADALDSAVQAWSGDITGVIFHSDHGGQCHSAAFAAACAASGVQQSMGTVGSGANNALAEAFFACLKREILPASGWSSTLQARLAVFGWLDFYNTRRRHSALGYLSPIEYETRSSTLAAAASQPVSTVRAEAPGWSSRPDIRCRATTMIAPPIVTPAPTPHARRAHHGRRRLPRKPAGHHALPAAPRRRRITRLAARPQHHP
uniref:integrase core domain-containing protein n=1 Tax=Actinomadura macrotermitis TaxID=2585200 RepID=UPI00188650BC|nr:integrase core domain-containing protein [Actinomadura macrotermitis]